MPKVQKGISPPQPNSQVPPSSAEAVTVTSSLCFLSDSLYESVCMGGGEYTVLAVLHPAFI